MLIIDLLLLYILGQASYSGFYLRKSKQLLKSSFIRKTTLGNQNNPQCKLFVSGDSVGVGIGASSFEKSGAGRVAHHLAEDQYVIFQNEAISGVKMGDLLTMPLPSEKQDIMLLIVSSNDLFKLTDVIAFKKQTALVMELYASLTEKLILVGPGRVFDGEAVPLPLRLLYKTKAAGYIQAMKEVLRKYPNSIYIDPTHEDFYKGSHGATTASDKFHPNDEGHRMWFDIIVPFL